MSRRYTRYTLTELVQWRARLRRDLRLIDRTLAPMTFAAIQTRIAGPTLEIDRRREAQPAVRSNRGA